MTSLRLLEPSGGPGTVALSPPGCPQLGMEHTPGMPLAIPSMNPETSARGHSLVPPSLGTGQLPPGKWEGDFSWGIRMEQAGAGSKAELLLEQEIRDALR